MAKSIIIIGAGDHAAVLYDVLIGLKENVIAFTSVESNKTELYSIPIIKDEDVLIDYSPKDVVLVNGIGSIGSLELRKKIFDKFSEKGFSFFTVIHPSAIISKNVRIGNGVQILAGCVINIGADIADNTIINSKSCIEHGCSIGRNVHIAPGCTLSGNVKIGDCTHIGTGSCIIQGISIGKNVLIGAGSAVVTDIPDNVKAFGNPAKIKS